jgi:hypothetical protein
MTDLTNDLKEQILDSLILTQLQIKHDLEQIGRRLKQSTFKVNEISRIINE